VSFLQPNDKEKLSLLVELSWYAVLRNVRALPPDKGGDIPAIALTACGRPEYHKRALEAGFQTFAVKPVKPDELVDIIQSVIKLP
jgi:CheY-like chemotaxis protein